MEGCENIKQAQESHSIYCWKSQATRPLVCIDKMFEGKNHSSINLT